MSQCDSKSDSDNISQNLLSIIYEGEVKGVFELGMVVNTCDPSTQ